MAISYKSLLEQTKKDNFIQDGVCASVGLSQAGRELAAEQLIEATKNFTGPCQRVAYHYAHSVAKNNLASDEFVNWAMELKI